MSDSNELLREKLPGAVELDGGRALRVEVADGPFERVTLLRKFRPETNPNIAEFFISFRDGSDSTTICNQLKKQLPAYWSGDSFTLRGAVFRCNDAIIHAITSSSGDPNWRNYSQTLWTLVTAAAFGGPGAPEADVRAIVGYPVSDLAKVPWGVEVKNASAAFKTVFPPVRGNALSAWLNLNIVLSHPLFKSVDFYWDNKKGARMNRVVFRSRENTFSRQDLIVACIEHGLQTKARIQETDHLKGLRDYKVSAGGISANVSSNTIFVEVNGGSPASKQPFTAMTKALEGCGR